MSDARLTRRRFFGLAAGGAAALTVAPLVTGRVIEPTQAATVAGKGVSPGKLMYLQPWEVAQQVDAIAAVTPGGWVRTDLDWARIERVPGLFDWEGADRAVHAAHDRGLRVIVILGTAPAWANGGQGWTSPPLDPASIRRFASAAATRYGPLGVAFEVWNEPNYSGSWRWPNAAAYTALLAVVHDEIKQASPSSTVVTGGMAAGATPRPVQFLTAMYAAGAAGHFDAVGYHPYCGTGKPLADGSGLLVTRDLHDLMAAHGDGEKQLWGTEIGWRIELLGVSDAMQATYLTQAYGQWAEWATAGWAGPLLWFNLHDTSMGLLDQHSQYGLFRQDWSARPAYWALLNA